MAIKFGDKIVKDIKFDGKPVTTIKTPDNEEYKKNIKTDILNYESLSVPRGFLAAASVGDYALFGGGYDVKDKIYYDAVDAYDTNFTHTMAGALRQQKSYVAATSVGDYAFFAGGEVYSTYTNTSYIDSVDAYTKDLTRHNVENLIYAYKRLAATSVGNYALFGGGESDLPSKLVMAYDDSLTIITYNYLGDMSLNQTRTYVAAASVGDYALFVGGYDVNRPHYIMLVDVFDKYLTKITTMDLPYGLYQAVGTSVGDYALIGGGREADYNYSEAASHRSTVDVFDKNLIRLEPVNLSDAKVGLAATSVGDYAFFGGGQHSDSTYSSKIDMFDTSLTKTTKEVSTPRGFLAATSVGDYAFFGGGFVANYFASSDVDVIKLSSEWIHQQDMIYYEGPSTIDSGSDIRNN